MKVKKIIIRIYRDWDWPDILQQTSGHSGIWDDLQFSENAEDYDFLIISNNLEENFTINCSPENVFRIIQEPPINSFKKWHENSDYSAKTFSCDPELEGNQYKKTQPMLPWHINRDYDFLSEVDIPKKIKFLSWITSTKKKFDGHKKRMNFLGTINGKIKELDLLGGGIYHLKNKPKLNNEREQKELGFKNIVDKWDGLSPYKYSIAIENYSGPDYWSEKIGDCFLSWTVPIYYGCTNLEDYFPDDSFIRIDIEKPEEAIEIIKNSLDNTDWERRIPALNEARNLVLNKYQLFPSIANYINSIT